MGKIARAANFAGLLAWREFRTVLTGADAGPSRDVACLFKSDPAGSSKRFAAVGCAVSFPPYSRASATALNRLPEHEVRGDGGGREGPLRVTMCREKTARGKARKVVGQALKRIGTRVPMSS